MRGLLDEAGGHPTPHLMGRHASALKHQGPGSHDGSLANLTVIEQRRTHAHQSTAAHRSPVYRNLMTDGDIIFEHHRGTVALVNTTAVLHIHPVAHPDGINIGTKHGIEPHATVATHHHISDNTRGLGEVTPLTPLRHLAAIRFDQRHVGILFQSEQLNDSPASSTSSS